MNTPRQSTEKWIAPNMDEFARQVAELTKPAPKQDLDSYTQGLIKSSQKQVKKAAEAWVRAGKDIEEFKKTYKARPEVQQLKVHLYSIQPENSRAGRIESAKKAEELRQAQDARYREQVSHRGQTAEEFVQAENKRLIEENRFLTEQKARLGITDGPERTREDKYQSIYAGMGKSVEGVENDINH